MLLPHAQTLAQARSYLAALSDRASTIDASSAYEHVLIELDRVHGDECPSADTEDLTEDRAIPLAVATSALEEEEEEEQILPAFADAATNQQLSDLGQQFTEAKDQAAAELD